MPKKTKAEPRPVRPTSRQELTRTNLWALNKRLEKLTAELDTVHEKMRNLEARVAEIEG